MAKSVQCKCEIGRFTCRYCLENAPPWFHTLASGERVYLPKPQKSKPQEET